MDYLTRVLFESPFRLGVCSFLLFAGVLFARLRMESEAARRGSLFGTLLLIALLFLVQKLVVTQREEIFERLDTLVSAIEDENITTIGGLIGAGFDSEKMDRDQFVTYVESFLGRWDIRDARLQHRDVMFDDGEAEMDLAARATVSKHGDVGVTHRGSWRIRWTRENGMWKVVAVRPTMIDGRPIRGLGALPR